MTKTEAQTRRDLIDKNLLLAGWNVGDVSQVIEEFDIDLSKTGMPMAAEPTTPYSGHRFADYCLLLHGKPIAVVEAKKTSKDAQLGKEQALQYAINLQQIHGGDIPFILYTNGYETYLWDSEFYPPIKVHGFPTREDFEWMKIRRRSRKPLSIELINADIAGRGYQIEAIRSILEGMEAKQRKFLLVMATGTGKTRTAAALFDVLLRARWAKRVLFLVDRIALQEQALDAFKTFLPHEPRWPRPGEKSFDKNRRIYVSTYPTMLNLIQKEVSADNFISPHFFDIIIADESHRSIYNIYKHVLEYFNAVKMGLTATPKDHVDFDTYQIFNCDTHDPTYAYTYEEAIQHEPPYLCDFEVLKVRSKFQLEGIKGGVLPPAIQKKLIEEGKDVEDIDFEGTDLERKVSNKGTNAVIVREFMEECIKDPTGTLPGKSIIFAISMKHARALQEVFDSLYPEHAGKLARVLVSDDRYVYGKGGLLDQFRTEDMPRVAISVDMLDTGVDVREVVNLVFAKPIYSYVKFWQMLGRGTRILDPDDIKSWCTEKDKFLIIDCWNNFEFFKMNPKGREPGAQESLPVKLFRVRLDKLEAAFVCGQTSVTESVKSDLRSDIEQLPKNILVAENRADLAIVEDGAFWLSCTATDLPFLSRTIAPVLRARTGVDIKTMRFEINVVEFGTAILKGNIEAAEAIREGIKEQVSELPLSLNQVMREKDIIDAVQSDGWWSDLADEKLGEMAMRLSPLMKYRQKKSTKMINLNIEDAIVIKEWIEFSPEHERMTTKAYRTKVEEFIRELVEQNEVLKKMEAGDDVTDAEIYELASLLEQQDLHVNEELLRKVYDHKKARFIQFIRHILGLEQLESWGETINKAFDEFIAHHNTFTTLQIRFLQMLKTFILQTGTVERENLIEAPFTQVHPQGIRGVFTPDEQRELVKFADNLVA